LEAVYIRVFPATPAFMAQNLRATMNHATSNANRPQHSRSDRAEYLLSAARNFADCLSCAVDHPHGVSTVFVGECAHSIARLIDEAAQREVCR
jgi:hypothetical protein